MKRIKTLFISFVALITMLVNIIPVNAASLSLSGSASTTSTVVGNTFTVSFTFSSSNPLGAVVYSMSYDSSLLTLVSGTQSNALSYTGSQKSDTVKFTFKAKAKGSATISFKINEALDFDGNALSAGSTSKTVNIKTQAEIEASYSKNNNLSSIELSNGSLSPEFNKDTTEYSTTVENEVTQITISGKKEDSKSSVEGFKTYDLDEGNNRIELKVTAQNGSSKTYVVNVTRKELAPINVKTEDGLDLVVVRKKELLKSPNDNYEETTIKIDEEEVPGFYNKSTDTNLVGLKDEDGIITLYVLKDEKYTKYTEFTFNSIIITASKSDAIPKGYKEEKITINDKEVLAYKDEESQNDYYLISGVNIATGEEHLYQYDKNENTLQIFNKDLLTKIDLLNEKNNTYLYIIIGFGSLLIITFIILLISSIRKNRKKIKNLDKKLEEAKEEVKEETIEKIEKVEETEKVEEVKEEPVKEKPKKKRRRNEFDFGDDNLSILDVEPIDTKKIEEEIKEELKEETKEPVEEPIEVSEEEKKEKTAVFEKPIDETQDIEKEFDKIDKILQKNSKKRRKRTKEIEK